MQLIPDTARRFGVRNILDPAQNIRGGMAYLRWLLAYFEGDLRWCCGLQRRRGRGQRVTAACRPTPRRATMCAASPRRWATGIGTLSTQPQPNPHRRWR
jgi:hypothetical protein